MALYGVCSRSFGARSFSVAAPKVWNYSLLPALRVCASQDTFVATLRLITLSRPPKLLHALLLAPQIRLMVTTVCELTNYIYLLTYL